MTQAELARRINLTKGAVNQWKKGVSSPNGENLLKVAKALGVTPEWLATGKGPKEVSETRMTVKEAMKLGLLEPIALKEAQNIFQNRFQKVPVISFVQAGNWQEVILNHPDDIEYLPCPVPCGPHTFALQVQGDSMLPRFHPGDYIFVDPDKEYKSGDFVVAQIDDENKATFKQYLETEDGLMLKALNLDWPNRYIPLPDKYRIIGRVIAKLEAL
jgi:SOS-response transcriptional repressor LexA